MYNSPVPQSDVKQSQRVLKLPLCIQVIKDEVGLASPSHQINYHGVSFYLSAEIIGKIQQAMVEGKRLSVESSLLSDLRYYILFGQGNGLPSGITFCSFYQSSDSSKALVRSFIALDGDSIHQICDDCLTNPQFALTINSAHHWLINQLISQLRLNVDEWLNTLALSISLPTVIASVIAHWEKFREDPWLFLFPPVMAWLLFNGLKRLLILMLPFLRRWCWRWLLSNSWFRHPITQKIALKALNILGI